MDNGGEGTQGTYPRTLTHDFLEELGLSIVASNCAPEEARLVLIRDPFHGNYPQVGRLINEVRAGEDVVLVEAETEIAAEHYGFAVASNVYSWEHMEAYALSMLVDDAQAVTGVLADEARLAEESDPELVAGEREAYGSTRSERLEQAYSILESLAELLHVNIRTLYMAWAIQDALELEQGRVFVIAGIDHYTEEVMETLLASTRTVVLEPPIDMEAVAGSEQSIPVLSLEFRQQIKQMWLGARKHAGDQ